MLEKIKAFFIKFVVLAVNTALVAGGVFFIKHQQEEKQTSADLATNASANEDQQAVAAQVSQLQQIIEQNRKAKNEDISKNTGTITIQKPTTVTQTIPAVTKTVQVPVTTSTPKKTTKKS
jgi:hypothetical protein